MITAILRKLQRHAPVAVILAASASGASAGLFCDWRCDPMRPFYSPACEPAWGYHETCWRRFPQMESCNGWGDYCPACQADGGAASGDYYADGAVPVQQFEAVPDQSYQMIPQAGTYSGTPTMQGAPLVVPGQTVVQPQQSYQPGLRYEAPGNNAYDANPRPSAIAPNPVPQPQDTLPAPDMMSPEVAPTMPPLPEPYQQSSLGGRVPVRSATYAAPVQGAGTPQYYQPRPVVAPQPQNLAAPPVNQRVPVRGISFNRVLPTSGAQPTEAQSYGQSYAQPPQKRTLLQKILPGGK
ncbi:MAG: hypothetical protein R3C49_07215 [Planctomycetaceae bacterium]